MKLSVVIFESDLKKVNDVLMQFNLNIELIFVNYDLNCRNNIEFYEYPNFSNVRILNYKEYDKVNIKNFVMNFISNKYVMLLDFRDINVIFYLKKMFNIFKNQDILILDLVDFNQLGLNPMYLIYNKDFLINNNLLFNNDLYSLDYLQIIKSIYASSNIMILKFKESLVMYEVKDKMFLFDRLFKLLAYEFKNIIESKQTFELNEFYMLLFKILEFLTLNGMNNELQCFGENFNYYNLVEKINEFLLENNENFIKKSKKENNLFIVHTPYHILLATSVCLRKENINCENSMFINDTFGCDEQLVENLKCIFKKIYIQKNDGTGNLVEDIPYIENYLSDNVYDNIYVNNDSEIKTQFIINHKLKKHGKLTYIEDGTANYRNFMHDKEHKKSDVSRYYTPVLNMYIETSQFIGTNSRIDEGYFLYPNLVMSQLKDNMRCYSLDCNFLKDSIKIIYSKYNLKDDDFILIALEHSEFVYYNTEYDLNIYIDVIKNLIYYLSSLGKTIYIKYHPRETNKYLNFDFDKYRVIILDKSLPIESLFCENMILISLRSTSLVTFSKLFTPEKAICIQNLLVNFENNLTYLFKNVGVFFPNTLDEIILKAKIYLRG